MTHETAKRASCIAGGVPRRVAPLRIMLQRCVRCALLRRPHASMQPIRPGRESARETLPVPPVLVPALPAPTNTAPSRVTLCSHGCSLE
eukprot:3369542-Prymnesium_polylepis.1